jgi:hypothetical protein
MSHTRATIMERFGYWVTFEGEVVWRFILKWVRFSSMNSSAWKHETALIETEIKENPFKSRKSSDFELDTLSGVLSEIKFFFCCRLRKEESDKEQALCWLST